MSQEIVPLRKLIIIDSQVNNWQRLANDVSTNNLVLILNSSSDGLTQISDFLTALSANAGTDDFTPLQSIHIISHGSSGSVLLGSSTLTANNLGLYTSQLATIGNALTENGDILLYGCNVAAEPAGLPFINQFAALTNADVAASDDITGTALLGGDWLLEKATGTIDSSLALSAATLNTYMDILDIFTGTEDSDTLQGGEDNDTLYGLGGSDILYGYGGDDLLDGGNGYDNLYGGQGNDILIAGSDIYGGSMLGDKGNDTLTGSAGVDYLFGGSGNDTILGGAGDDEIYDYEDSNSIDAGAGNDRIDVYSFNAADINTITGGIGSDTYILNTFGNIGQRIITDFAAGAGGDVFDINGLIYTGGNPFGTLGYLRLLTDGADTLLQGDIDGSSASVNGWQNLARLQNVAVNTLTAENFMPQVPPDGNSQGVTVTGTTGSDSLQGGILNDALYGLAGDDTLQGTGGDDLLDGGDGYDILFGGQGDDILIGGTDNTGNHLFGGEGNDSLTGSAGSDDLNGGSGNDTVVGGAGDDTISDVEGSNSIDAGAGNDRIDVSSYNSTDINTLTGSAGSDTYILNNFGNLGQRIITDFAAGAGGDIFDINGLIYSDGNPFGTLGYLRLLTESADTLLQWDQDGAFDSNNGWRTLARLQNVDASTLTAENFTPLAPPDGSSQGTTIIGTPGNDTLKGGVVNDALYGLAGDDQLIGYGGDDLLDGGDGYDELFGGQGNDTLIGGEGNDQLNGEQGNDILIAGIDTTGNHLFGGEGNDSLTGSAGSDDLNGGSGNDTVVGGAGDDTISDVEGSNSIDAGAGNDKIYVYSYNAADINTLTGGTGSDTYVFYGWGNEGQRIITDFAGGSGGDILKIDYLLNESIGYSGGDPYGTLGYMRFLRDGADLLLQWDRDGASASTYGWQTLARLQNAAAPTLTAFASAVASGNENSEIKVAFADLQTQGNEADVDGTVTAFVVKAVSSGTLKIGIDAATATGWSASLNDTVDASHQAYWTPDANANGALNAFTAVAKDNDGLESVAPVQATVNVAVPYVNLSAGVTPEEGGASGTFIVTLDKPAPAGGLTVNYLLAGTATPSTDYTITAGSNLTAVTGSSFTIAAGQTSAVLNINALNDVLSDPNETVSLSLITGTGYQLAPGIFSPKVDYATHAVPTFISVGDFNNDGKLDLAVAEVVPFSGTGWVAVLLNSSSDASADYMTGDFPSSVSVGDFNNDGKLDIAAANAGDNTVSVLLRNTANTGFDAKVDYVTGEIPSSVSVGDFNNDGKLDLAVANLGSNTVSVLLRNTTNTGFENKIDIATGELPASVGVGDFDNDGKLDLAVANAGSNTVSVLLRNAANTGFDTNVDYVTGVFPVSASMGDFNNDGKLDLAVANYESNTVSLLMRNSTNTSFDARVDYVTGANPTSVSVGDFNNDGKLDLAVVDETSNTVSVLLRNTLNTGFDAKVDYTTGFSPESVGVGDFNNDGKLDLAIANYDSNTVSVLLNDANPTATLIIAEAVVPITGTPDNDTLQGGVGNDTLYGLAGDDQLFGYGGDDLLDGGDSNDTLSGGQGNDTLVGGIRSDVAVFGGAFAGYQLSYDAGVITVKDTDLSNGNDGTDTLSQIETLRFSNRDIPVVDGLRYIASYGDLINAFHANTEAGLKHYFEYGINEGRTVNFDPEFYLAKYGDLRTAFGADLNAATAHYVNYGFGEGRTAGNSGNDSLNGSDNADTLNAGPGDDVLTANAGNDTLIGGAGNDTLNGGACADLAVFGSAFAGYQLSYNAGVISVIDTYLADGNDGTDALTQIETLRFANRDIPVVDGLRYIASHGDLINVFHADAEAGLKHYFDYGINEGRTVSFDPEFYLAKYGDLQAVFGPDANAATLHYINYGFWEGRTASNAGNDSLNGSDSADILNAGPGDDVLNGNAGNDMLTGGLGNDTLNGGDGIDLAVFGGAFAGFHLSYGGGVITVTDTNLSDGIDGSDTLSQIETLRFTDRDIPVVDGLRYIASNGDLINAFHADAEAGLKHYFEYGINEGRTVSFDPEFYLAKYGDLRAAFGADLNAATNHYINYGFGEGRTAGNAGNDSLNGSDSADTLNAGPGDDVLTGNAGNDTLNGGDGDDILDGGAGNDLVNGGLGHDVLTGGPGQDTFQFMNLSNDTLTDFSVADDTLQLEDSVFTQLTAGDLNAYNFHTGSAAADANDYLIYDNGTGALLYDADGIGAGSATQIALLGGNLALTAADFLVI